MEWTYEDLEKMLDALAGVAEEQTGKPRRILDAATELFILQGYRKTSVEEVARRAHVAKGTIYLYFATKADLLIATVVEEKRAYFSLLKPIFDPDIDAEERLSRYLMLMLTMARKMPLTSRLLSGDRELMIVMEEMDPEFRQGGLEMQTQFLADLLSGVVGDRLRPEEVRLRARVLLGLMMASGFFVDDDTRLGVPLEAFARTLTDWLVGGLAAPCVSTGKERELAHVE